MQYVIVERNFDTPRSYQEVMAKMADPSSQTCLDMHEVEFVRSYIAKDMSRQICVFKAKDAESVRQANRHAGMIFDIAYSAEGVPFPDLPNEEQAKRAIIIADRIFDGPDHLEQYREAEEYATGCNRLYGIDFLGGFCADDSRHAFCVYAASDAETVRVANRQSGLPYEAVWSAEITSEAEVS